MKDFLAPSKDKFSTIAIILGLLFISSIVEDFLVFVFMPNYDRQLETLVEGFLQTADSLAITMFMKAYSIHLLVGLLIIYIGVCVAFSRARTNTIPN
ncbi:MAG: hypothetical protein Q8Q18_02490 [bacterium]|nr:hypothetical protein [bacterium]